MKAISAALAAHMALPQTTMANFWKITRRDSAVYCFTDHDRQLRVDGLLYSVATVVSASDLSSGNNLDVDNRDVQILTSSAITSADLRAGLWDGATITAFQANWADLSMGSISMPGGTVGQMTDSGNYVTAEVLGLQFALQSTVVRVTQAACDAQFGDQRCTIDVALHTVTGEADSFDVDTLTVFASDRVEADGYFRKGKLTFTGGLNDGLSFEVKDYVVGELRLQSVPPYAIAATDPYSLQRGCDKKQRTCIDDYANGPNFRGFPHLQGNDKLAQVGRRK